MLGEILKWLGVIFVSAFLVYLFFRVASYAVLKSWVDIIKHYKGGKEHEQLKTEVRTTKTGYAKSSEGAIRKT
jgi:hypothetical protein